ncbi:PQQ-binding-like beta-propeller repeat protein [Microbulbifer sp. EKSA008]|uniref:outer membrane protein assembly factor BamB family protein n=1 Tax=Microbulbifer sp. EKSA008 TaxID=3243367 RepID=UPI0040435713
MVVAVFGRDAKSVIFRFAKNLAIIKDEKMVGSLAEPLHKMEAKVVSIFFSFFIVFSPCPIVAATTASVSIDAPGNDTLVPDRFPDVEVSLANVQNLSNLELKISQGRGVESLCLIDLNENIGLCSLTVSLDDGWQAIDVSLYSDGSLVSKAAISVAVDEDRDGIADHLDKCTNTIDTEVVDVDGCSPVQLDSDNDGISNVDEFLLILPAINMLLDSPYDPVEEPKPLENAIEDGLFFESPAHKALVVTDKPSLRLRANSSLDLTGAKLTVSIGNGSAESCSFDPDTKVGKCDLTKPIGHKWTDIEAVLFKSDTQLARSVISVALDSDEDGIANSEDFCSSTSLDETANSLGCAPSQIDSDFDGISDIDEIAAGSNPFSGKSYPSVKISAFTALPEKISRAGDSVGLSWITSGATSVSLTNNADDFSFSRLPAEGNARVAPNFSTTYTVVATGPGGKSSANVQVKVGAFTPQNQWGESPLDQVAEAISTSLTVSESGAVFLGAFDNNYYRFSPKGDLDWTLKDVGVVMNKGAIQGSTIFIGTSNSTGGTVAALDGDKTTRWTSRTESAVIGGPVLNSTGTVVYAATYDGSVYGFNTVDGQEQWSYQLPEGETVSATPALSRDGATLYVHSNSHNVYALSLLPSPLLMMRSSQSLSGQSPSNNAQSQTNGTLLWKSDIGKEE